MPRLRTSARRAIVAGIGAVMGAAACVSAQAGQLITVAALPFLSSAPLFIAKERGYYTDEGLEVEIRFFRAAQPVAVAIATGEADFGVTAFTAELFNLAGRGALKVIGAQSREEPGFDFSAYVVSNKALAGGFTSPANFRGHTLGMTTTGSSFHYMIGQLIDHFGWPEDAVTLRPLQTVPNMVSAVIAGEVDAIILPAHIVKPLDAAGAAHIIGWVQQYTPYQLGALFTSARNIETRRAMVEKFVHAYQRGASDYHDAMNRLDAQGNRVFGASAEAIVEILMDYVGPDATPQKIKDGAPYIDPLGRLDVTDVHRQVAWYQRQGLVDPAIEADRFIDLSFIRGHFNLPD
jgi:NitT/TauT family transport system substrate-binding protein